MAQLEASKRQPRPHSLTLSSVRRTSPNADLLSPLDTTLDGSSGSSPKPDVEEWIAKARESIEAFEELIGAGGVGMTKDFLVEGDLENSGSDDDTYEFAVEDDDGEAAAFEVLSESAGAAGHRGRSTSSNTSGNSGGSGRPKKKSSNGSASQKLATLPGEAAPFGLIASLALKTTRRRSSGSAEDEDDVGVANEDFFRSMYPYPPRVIFILTYYADRSYTGFDKDSYVE